MNGIKKYDGLWKQGKREGEGILYDQVEGISYVGNFRNGMKSGFGILYSNIRSIGASNNKLDFCTVLYKGQWDND